MLRFNRSDRRPPNYLSQREQLRALRLVLAVGLVLLLIGVVRSPRAVQMLGIFFGGPPQPEQAGVGGVADGGPIQDSTKTLPRQFDPAARPAAAVDGLADVRDNAAFRSEENGPWYELLGILRSADPERLAAESVGELMAVQLLEQPEVYRGRLVDVRGTARQVLRSEPLASRPTPEALLRLYFHPLTELPARGLRTTIAQELLAGYHRVVIQQAGAAVPIIVFTLSVPQGFPQGEAVSEPVVVSGGYFFKNWLYAADDGLGVAPVVLARQIEWRPAPPPAVPQRAGTSDVALAIGLAVVLAIVATWWLLRRSREAAHPVAGRPGTLAAPPDFSSVDSRPFPTQHQVEWPSAAE